MGYNVFMDIQIASKRITLITTTRSTIASRIPPYIHTAITKFGKVLVVDAGFNLNPHIIVNHLVENHINPLNILDNTLITRAFSCYQLQSTLAGVKPSNTPLVILFMLSTFDSEDINIRDRRRILSKCIQSIKAYPGSVLVIHHYRCKQKELFDQLKLSAGTVLSIGLPSSEPKPLTLFEDNNG